MCLAINLTRCELCKYQLEEKVGEKAKLEISNKSGRIAGRIYKKDTRTHKGNTAQPAHVAWNLHNLFHFDLIIFIQFCEPRERPAKWEKVWGGGESGRRKRR